MMKRDRHIVGGVVKIYGVNGEPESPNGQACLMYVMNRNCTWVSAGFALVVICFGFHQFCDCAMVFE